MNNKVIIVIPARAASTRFPNKPLYKIAGKEMLLHVVENARKSMLADDVVVATEHESIFDFCYINKINCEMTSVDHPTGTDRTAEVSERYAADLYLVLMGDEPLINFEQIDALIKMMLDNPHVDAGMLCSKFKKPVDVINSTTIKLALNDVDDLIFISRSPIPYPKGCIDFDYYKNMGCYAFRKEALDFFASQKPGRIERAEEIEMLRFLEAHKIVKCMVIESDSFSIDTKNDLEKAIKLLEVNSQP